MINNFFGISFALSLSILVGLGMLALWIWTFIDVLRSSKPDNEKLLWGLVLLFFNIFGVLVYFLSKEGNFKKRKKSEKLQKTSDDSIISGVCGGFARYLRIDSTILRLLVVLFSIVSFGSVFFLYIIAALIMPSDKKKEDKKKPSKTSTTIIVAISAVLIIASGNLFPGFQKEYSC